jgi:hypothetical protein
METMENLHAHLAGTSVGDCYQQGDFEWEDDDGEFAATGIYTAALIVPFVWGVRE